MNDSYEGPERRVNPYRSENEELKELIKDLGDKIKKLEDKVDAQVEATKDIVFAWSTAKGISSFVKWIGSLAVGAGILLAIFKNWARLP